MSRSTLSRGRLSALSLSLPFLLLSACSYDFTVDLPNQQVPGDRSLSRREVALGDIHLGPSDLDTGGYDLSSLRAVNLVGLTARVTDGLGDNDDDLSWLQQFEVFVQTKGESDGLQQIRVAWQDQFPAGDTEVELNVDDSADLLPYLDAGATLLGIASGTVPPDDVQIGGTATIALKLF